MSTTVALRDETGVPPDVLGTGTAIKVLHQLILTGGFNDVPSLLDSRDVHIRTWEPRLTTRVVTSGAAGFVGSPTGKVPVVLGA